MELPSSSLSNYKAWTFEENKLFENFLAKEDFHNSKFDDWWDVISNVFLRGKRTPEEVKNHYYNLVYDVNEIENDKVCIPKYNDDNDENYDNALDSFIHNHENTKCTQWSKDEHRLFLIGEVIYGGGDWRSIARMIVRTRSSTQVASHAQKFYDRKKKPKNTKRASIHDITTVDHETALDLHQRKLISFENLQTYLGKLASKTRPDQQVNKDDINNSSQVSNKSSLHNKKKTKKSNKSS